MDKTVDDIMEEVDNIKEDHDQNKIENNLQVTVGILINKLEKVEDKSKNVVFDFGYFRPDELNSYRGYYQDLAISYSDESKSPTVEEFLELLREAIGTDFTGYKGGKFTINEDSMVWVAQWGNNTNVALSGVRNGFRVVLETTKVEEETKYGERM